MKIALKTGGWLIVVAWAILVACLPGGDKGNETIELQVTSPAAGDTWLIGETKIIKWEPSCGDGDIYLGQNDTSSEIAHAVSLRGREYTWNVGVLSNGKTARPGSNYHISLSSGPWCSGQSGIFTIGPKP